MAIYDLLAGVAGPGGTVNLICKRCVTAAQDASTSESILKVCSICGMPLGEWKTVAERDAELRDFIDQVKHHLK